MLKIFNTKNNVLALGAESAGNFCHFKDGEIYHSPDFGDLADEKNWKKFRTALTRKIIEAGLRPRVILSDLHPDFLTTRLAKDLAKKYKAKYIPVQHHIAHIFSAIGDKFIHDTSYMIPDTFCAIASDGTGLGTDGKIWGGEIFKVKSSKLKVKSLERIGHLENQILIGGDLAIREPARMLIGILLKFLDKNETYRYVKKYYSKNEFEVMHSQLKQNFNSMETSSTGRVLDAISLLLGFCQNERKYKHEPIDLLEKNSTVPYDDLRPEISMIYDENTKTENYILNTSHLFNYVINYLHKNKRLSAEEAGRLAATAQLYIAEGLYEIASKLKVDSCQSTVYFSGGMANNKIISTFLESKEVYVSKKIPRGDAGISFGQIIYYLLADPRN